jgi:hypothetical protein
MSSNALPIVVVDGKSYELIFAVPPEEASAACREGVPVEVMAEVRTLLEIMRSIHGARKVRPEAKRQSALCANRWQANTLVAKYYLFIRGDASATPTLEPGNWRLLLNRAKAPVARKNEAVLKFAFFEFWRKLGESNSRVWSAAHTELIQIWKTGFGFPRGTTPAKRYTKIPGYDVWPAADSATGIPEGWTAGNLMRHTSDPYEQKAARVGRRASTALRLPVLTSRTNLRVGQYYEFDDHEFDQKVMFQKKPMRPLGFGVVDVFSGCCFQQGFKPTLWDFEEEVKRKLTEREFMWFVIAVLCGSGYRNDKIGTTLVVERGTAAIRDAFRERIERVFNGRVKVEVGGRFLRPAHNGPIEKGGRNYTNSAHDGQFQGQGKGNFRTKALIEGYWSIVENQLGSAAAQVGKDRDHAPEQLYGIEQYTAALMREADKAGLSPERRALLQLPIPTYHLWREAALEAFRRVNFNRDHKLQGWEKLGFVQSVWRLPEAAGEIGEKWLPWSAFEALPEGQREVIRSILNSRDDLVRPFRLNRQEVFSAHRRELTQAPLELLPELVGVENAINGGVPKAVGAWKGGLFSFDAGEVDSDPIHFYARDVAKNSAFLTNGHEFVCFVNPYDSRALVACERTAGDKLRVVAVCPRYELADKADAREVQLLMGEQAAYEASARQNLNLRHGDKAAEIQDMTAHNQRVLGGVPITGAEKVRARQQLAAAEKAPYSPPPAVPDCTEELLARADEAEANKKQD